MLWRSHIFSDLNGSVAGVTYFKGTYGHCARARVKPVDVNSNALEAARAFLSQSVAGWKALSDADRQLWKDYASSTPWTNALGESINLTGQAMYVATRSLVNFGEPLTADTEFEEPPCTPGLNPQPYLQTACCPNLEFGVVVTVNNTSDTEAMNFVVQRSPALSPGASFKKGPFRPAEDVLLEDVAAGSSDDASFCDLCDGATYVFRVRGYSAVSPYRMCTEAFVTATACETPI